MKTQSNKPVWNIFFTELCAILNLQGSKLKQYTFPDGVKIDVQGYEPFLLDILVKEGYNSSDIITDRTEVPEVWYINNDNKSRYYCDAYIPKTNTIYEVKSIWTYEKDITPTEKKNETNLFIFI